MATITTSNAVEEARTFAELVERLGNVPLERIRLHPLPGTATIDDLIRVNESKFELRCELIDGVLVERALMSYLEDQLATILVTELQLRVRRNRDAKVFTAGAIYKMTDGNFRVPDVTVCLSDKFPGGKVERVPYVDFAPDLAVEVLSKSNRKGEIDRKRRELFETGTKLIWVVNPASRSVDVYTSFEDCTTLTEDDTITGGDVLPGFELSIRDWFREAEEV